MSKPRRIASPLGTLCDCSRLAQVGVAAGRALDSGVELTRHSLVRARAGQPSSRLFGTSSAVAKSGRPRVSGSTSAWSVGLDAAVDPAGCVRGVDTVGASLFGARCEPRPVADETRRADGDLGLAAHRGEGRDFARVASSSMSRFIPQDAPERGCAPVRVRAAQSERSVGLPDRPSCSSFVDTNVLVYRHDITNPEKKHRADDWLACLVQHRAGRLSLWRWQVD